MEPDGPSPSAEAAGVAAERYRELFRHAPVGQAIYDLEGRIVEANAALHELLGYPVGSLVGRHVLDLTHPEDHSLTRRQLGRIDRREIDSYTQEKRYARADGSPIWCRLSVVTVRGETGEPLYYISLINDITERRHREELLGLALEQLRGVFAHAPIGLAILDGAGGILDANPELCRTLARSRQDLVGRGIDALRPPEDVVMSPTDVAGIVRGVAPSLEVERRFVKPDGRYVHTRITVAPLPLSEHEADARLVALVEDITEQRRIEWERELAERRFRTMFEDAAVGQVITTLTGTVVDANPRFCRIVGRALGEVEGTALLAFAHPDEAALPNELLRELLFGDREAFTREQRFLRPDGSTVHTELHVAMGPGASGGPEHLVVQVTDVTERKLAEERLAETLQELEERNQDLEHFATVASHDLKTPLQTVVGFLELLGAQFDGTLTDEQRMYVERALAGGIRMRNLIDSVLDFARSGTQSLELEAVSVGTVMRDVEANLAAQLEATGGSVALTHDGVVPADRRALTQVMQNLVANALKFAGQGRAPRVEVEVEPADPAVVRVHDDGPGIAPEQRDDLFDMFTRGTGTVGITGAGIGLTTCRRLIERMGGRIWIEDSPMGGATFAFSLPRPDGG